MVALEVVEKQVDFLERNRLLCRKHDAHHFRALLSARPLERALPRVVRAATRGVAERGLQMRAVIEQRIIPRPGFIRRACRTDKRLELLVSNTFLTREKLVQKHSADVGLQIHRGAVARERDNACRRCRTDARKRHKLVDRFGQLPLEILRANFACALEGERAAVVAKPLPFAHNVRRARARQGIGRGELRQEALPAAENTLHLRLLEHYLGDQHRIGVIDIPPGQIAVKPRTLAAHQSNERLLRGGVRGPRAGRQFHASWMPSHGRIQSGQG